MRRVQFCRCKVDDYIAHGKALGRQVQIFVASDDSSYIKTFRAKYTQLVFTQPGNVLRGARGSKNSLNPWRSSKGNAFQKGVQVRDVHSVGLVR